VHRQNDATAPSDHSRRVASYVGLDGQPGQEL
jgi:hypothetical protein